MHLQTHVMSIMLRVSLGDKTEVKSTMMCVTR